MAEDYGPAEPVTIFLCGDVMPGRGVDQILPRSCPPHLYEPYVRSALDYVRLAEQTNGPIPAPVPHDWVWGEALAELERVQPDARVVNLETNITTSEDAASKPIHYRMHPANTPVLTAAAVDCCVLANNHVLDWGVAGLLETLACLADAGIDVAGAGADPGSARAPARLDLGGGSALLVFGMGVGDSGIPADWSARGDRPGVNRLPDLSDATVATVADWVAEAKRPADIALASIHWGGNWGYEIPAGHRRFAHRLIESAGIDLVHGHSSHHPKAVEVHQGRLILYGCGDFLDDYEGISGYEAYRDDLVVMYFPTLEPRSGRLLRLAMTPLKIRNMRLQRPEPAELDWMTATLDTECRRFGGRVKQIGDDLLLDLIGAAAQSDA